ncbi:mitochondrial inner membrane protein OXA1L isoform X2 [Panulirus ornatus]|uniref:mitochondrial inner membrane protein OXA1L isoform X2 n=1 Tax=Panulirus ornatus TaxID=150431 RepID=UPI003A860DEB
MASAVRCYTRCLAKSIRFTCPAQVHQSVTTYKTTHNVGCWLASSSRYHTALTWQKNKWVPSGSSFRLFTDYSEALEMLCFSVRHTSRHNSTASNIFNEMFILNAESPIPNEDITDPAAVHSELDTAAVDIVSQDSLHLVHNAATDMAVLHSDSGGAAVQLTQEVAADPFPNAAAIPSVPDDIAIPLVQNEAVIPSVPDDAALASVRGDAAISPVLDDAIIPSVVGDAAIPSVPEDAAIPSILDAATKSSVPDADAVHSHMVGGATHSSDITAGVLSDSKTSFESIAYIPPPPAPPEAVGPVLNALGEPTFQSIGLGGWSPAGIIQNCLEYLHVTVDLPWWGAICVATVVIRTLIFPLVLMSQRNAAKMNNYLPQLQILQMKMTEARNCGDQMNASRYGQEMVMFMKEKDISPLRNMIVPLAQAPIFISMFIGLRGLANLPVESFRDGGLFWFTDLTVCDPYYLLPVITSLTMYATIEAVLCYWVSTNLYSLVQVGFLRIPAIRNYFKIDAMITHKPETLPQQKKGVVGSFKESWKNMQITREIADRERYDEMRFKKSGAGPIVRTYKHDPTKRVIQAKMRGK